MEIFTHNLLWTEGQSIIFIVLILVFLGFTYWRPLVIGAVCFALFNLYFFRNPIRTCPELSTNNNVIVSPSDGIVVDMQYNHDPLYKNFYQKVSIFLSPLDVHVNWAPISGKITDISYHPGEFNFAFLPKSSHLNEHNDMTIQDKDRWVLVRQIAGTLARRIVSWVNVGQTIHAGDKYGMIKFGSRVDVFFPKNVQLTISRGQKVYGGQTVLGYWHKT